MGGRGASSGLPSIGPAAMKMLNAVGTNRAQKGANWQHQGDYTDGDNPQLLKYQGQEDDKTANFLASTDRSVDLNDPQYADGYAYHDLPLNKLLLRMGINGGPEVVSESDFNAYVKQSGQQVFYRGWSGQAAADRFISATHNHVGNGLAGDGYYFTPDLSTAKSYGNGVVTKMALSPTARVIDWNTLKSKMGQMSSKLQSAFHYAGTSGSGRTYGSNIGESQAALKLGYNVIDMGGGYYVGVTADAFVISKKYITY